MNLLLRSRKVVARALTKACLGPTNHGKQRTMNPREDAWRAKTDPLYRPQTMAGWFEYHERNKLPTISFSNPVSPGASRTPQVAKPKVTPQERAYALCAKEAQLIGRDQRALERAQRRRSASEEVLANRARILQARRARYEHALSQVQASPFAVAKTLRTKDWEGTALPAGAKYSDNMSVGICGIVTGVGLTVAFKYASHWNLDPHFLHLGLICFLAIFVAALFFDRHLVLARRMALTVILAGLSTGAYFLWLSQGK